MSKVLTLLQDAVMRRKAWSFPLPVAGVDPTGADDHSLHLANTGERSLMVLDGELSSTVAGNLEPFRSTTLVAGSNTPVDIIIASLVGIGGAKPKGVFETGVNLVLNNSEAMGAWYLQADVARFIEFATIILPNTAWGVNWEISTGILSGRLRVVELTPEDDPA